MTLTLMSDNTAAV